MWLLILHSHVHQFLWYISSPLSLHTHTHTHTHTHILLALFISSTLWPEDLDFTYWNRRHRNLLCCCCFSVAHSCPTLWDPMDCSLPGLPVHHHLPELAQTHFYWVDDAIQPSCPLLSPSPPAFNLSQHQGLFQWVNSSYQVWPTYWSFSFSISSSNEYSGLISFRMDWFDLLSVQGTLKSLPQNHSSKASILWCSAFFVAQLSHPYETTGKTIALTIQTFVGKVMSLLFNTLSMFVRELLAFLKSH